LSIGLSAGASLPFDIGVASGGVSLLASLSVDWTTDNGGSVDFVLRVALHGEVSILGIVSVDLLLALEARYDGSSLTCTGTLSLSIKMGWIFSIDIHTQVSFTLGGGGGSRLAAQNANASLLAAAPAPDPIAAALRRYRHSYGGA
jgi:hypothetical protein